MTPPTPEELLGRIGRRAMLFSTFRWLPGMLSTEGYRILVGGDGDVLYAYLDPVVGSDEIAWPLLDADGRVRDIGSPDLTDLATLLLLIGLAANAPATSDPDARQALADLAELVRDWISPRGPLVPEPWVLASCAVSVLALAAPRAPDGEPSGDPGEVRQLAGDDR